MAVTRQKIMMEKKVVAQGALPQDHQHREKGELLVQNAL